MKRFIAMLLCLTMLGCSMSVFPITANGEEQPAGTPISTVDEFLAMSPSGEYYLAGDIDFSGKTYTKNLYTKSFSGVLDGNGHALLGITVSATNSDAGIFANGFHGTLKNLTFGSANAPNNYGSHNAVTQNFENIVFSLPNVRNYDELLAQMQKDKNFERLVTSMSIDRLAGKSSLAKGKAIR